jgi:hypothetical protein
MHVGEGGQPDRQGSQSPRAGRAKSLWRGRLRGSRAWIAGVAATVISALILGLFSVVFDVPWVADKIRSIFRPGEQDIGYTVQHPDPGYDLVLPAGVELTAEQQRLLRTWSVESPDATNTLGRLITDLRAKGGANPNELNLRVTLEGQRRQTINVDGVYPVNIRRTKPYDGTFLSIPPQEPGETIGMMLNFDEVNPRARVAVNDGGEYKPGDLFFQQKTLKIEDAKEDALFIKSIATRSAVTFEIRVDYRLGDESKHRIINDHGRPFALTPMNCADHTRRAEDGQPITNGHASYDHIWKLNGDFKGIVPVRSPDRFKIGNPYC